MSDLEVSIADEIHQLSMDRPHVVILGTGASRATVPDGDKNGRTLPLMADFVKVTGIADLLHDLGIPEDGRNFEDVFNDLIGESHAYKREALEAATVEYFDCLELPNEPTIYDHLVLSLRKKDLVATFNWDPLLLQAYSRNGGSRAPLPRLAFLHGNVRIGYCATDRTTGLRDDNCSKCGKPRTPAPLLYPIKRKDYSANGFIANEWSLLRESLRSAFWVTIFGYSAPRTDQEARRLMLDAWGSGEARPMEQIEVISVDHAARLRDDWDPFIHSHHYDIISDFYESWIAKHPRHTGEAYENQYWSAKFISDNPIPRTASFPELREWIAPLIRREGFTLRITQ